MSQRQAGLGYYLFTKSQLWKETQVQVDLLTLAKLNKTVAEV